MRSGFFRTLSLHLQVVWEISLGFKFFICSDAIVWAWTVLMVIIEYYFSGFSYQLGRMCQINYANGYATFWGELFAFGGLILFFQSWTICYTIRTAFRSTLPISWGHRKNTSQGSSSINTKLLRSSEVWRRIGKLLIMQWRFVLLVVAVFFHAIIISYALLGSERNFAHTPPGVREWMECVIAEGKEKCLPKAANLLPTENVVVASLAMLAVSCIFLSTSNHPLIAPYRPATSGHFLSFSVGKWSLAGLIFTANGAQKLIQTHKLPSTKEVMSMDQKIQCPSAPLRLLAFPKSRASHPGPIKGQISVKIGHRQ